MRKKQFLYILAAAATVLCSGPVHAAGQIKIAVVFATGGLGDKSFNDSAMEGLKQAAAEFGITYHYAEPGAIAEYPVYLSRFAGSRAYDLIIAIGFDQADALRQAAGRFARQKFAIIDTTVDMPNVASCIYREQERGFLLGCAAGLMTSRAGDPRINRDRVVGVVGGMKIPLIDDNIAGFVAGADYADPQVKVLRAYVGHWADPAKGKELAISMFEKGADIIWGAAGRSGLGVISAAKERNRYAIGSDADQGYLAPQNVLTNGMKYVDASVRLAVARVAKGQFAGGVHLLGVKEGALGYSRSLLPEDILEKLETVKNRLAGGEIQVPQALPTP